MSGINPRWIKSSHSGGSGNNCVEIAIRPKAIRVRDSKDTRITPLTLTPTAWSTFKASLAGS